MAFFGLPSFNKYQAKEVFTSKRKISVRDIATPAVTICASDNSDTYYGWKSNDYDYDLGTPCK